MNDGSKILLETTIQIDRLKSGSRRETIENALKGFDATTTTTITLLEFKATLIRQLIIIHNQLRLKKRYTAARDALIEKDTKQSGLRSHIFNNMLAICASSLDIEVAEDELLAERAMLLTENHIRQAYRWFRYKSVDLISSAINCTRAAEMPEKKRVTYARMPTCKRGLNKSCNVERRIRDNYELIRALKKYDDPKGELERALALAERVKADGEIDLSHRDCRSAGDCLIAIEGIEDNSHVMSTNLSEWSPLCETFGYEFVCMRYPEEKTR